MLADAVDRLERLIDGLLVLARSEQGQLLQEDVEPGGGGGPGLRLPAPLA